MGERIRPLSSRQSLETVIAYDALHPGVRPWMRASIDRCIRSEIEDNNYEVTRSRLAELEVAARLSPGLEWSGNTGRVLLSLMERLLGDETLTLDVVDLLLHGVGGAPARPSIAALARLLEASGSEWRVEWLNHRTAELSRRVMPEALRSVDNVVAAGGATGQYLRNAMTAAFGRNPAPDKAHRDAILALERALHDITMPNDDAATLGRMLGHLRTNRGDYETRLKPQRPQVDGVDAFIDLVGVVWHSDLRHADLSQANATYVTPEQAQDAVLAAALACEWVRSGAFRKVV